MRALAITISIALGLALSSGGANAQRHALEMTQDCNGQPLQEVRQYPITGWNGQRQRALGEQTYEFRVDCGGITKTSIDLFLASVDRARYEMRGATLYAHTRDERRFVRIPESERGCEMVPIRETCVRTQDELRLMCGDNMICRIENSAYDCIKQERRCARADGEYQYVPLWEPFPVGHAPLPDGARIVQLAVSQTQTPVSPSGTPVTRTQATLTEVNPPGLWSRFFSFPLAPAFLFALCAGFFGVARIGDFDKTTKHTEWRLLAVGVSLFALWLAAVSGEDGLVVFCLFFLFPAAAFWLASADFTNFCQGFVFMRVRPPADGFDASREQSLLRELEETHDAMRGYPGKSPFWQRIYERAHVEALKTSNERQSTRSDYLKATTQGMRASGDMSDEAMRLQTKAHLQEGYKKTERAEQEARLAGRVADAEKRLAEKMTRALEASNTLEAVEEFKEDKMELGRARYQGRIAQAKSDTAYAQADQHTSEQARDEVRGARSATGEEPSQSAETDEIDSFMAAQQEDAMNKGDTEKAMFWAAERTKRRKGD